MARGDVIQPIAETAKLRPRVECKSVLQNWDAQSMYLQPIPQPSLLSRPRAIGSG